METTTSEYEEALTCYENDKRLQDKTMEDQLCDAIDELLAEKQQLQAKIQEREDQDQENLNRLARFNSYSYTEYDQEGRFIKMGNVRKLDEVELRGKPCCQAWMAGGCSDGHASLADYPVRIGDDARLFCDECLKLLGNHALRVVGQKDQAARSRAAQQAAKRRWG
jgi:hypothetical protein